MDQTEIIRWQLKYLSEHAGDMRPNDLEWAIKFEERFKRAGMLSPREQEILEDIYKRY